MADNIDTIEDLCRAGGVDGYVRARVDQAVAEVSKRARIEALEDCKRVLDAYDPDGPFRIIAGGPSCREELRGEDITRASAAPCAGAYARSRPRTSSGRRPASALGDTAPRLRMSDTSSAGRASSISGFGTEPSWDCLSCRPA